MANSVDPDQTAPIGAVCSGFTLLLVYLDSPVMLGNYLQQTTSADDIFRCNFFLGALRVKAVFGIISSKNILLYFQNINLLILSFNQYSPSRPFC